MPRSALCPTLLADAAAVDWAAAYDSEPVRAYLEEFERVYAQAQAPTRCR